MGGGGGGGLNKERVSVLLGCNMDGTEKLPVLVIGKAAKPRCFKNVKTLPMLYKNNKSAWMTGAIFNEFRLKIDQ